MATGNDADGESQDAFGTFDTRIGRWLAFLGAAVGLLGMLLVLVGGTDPTLVPTVTQLESYIIAVGVVLVVLGTLITHLTKRFGL